MSQPLVVVTGTVGGIGAEISAEMTRRGWRVVSVDVARPAADLDHFPCDLGVPAEVEQVFKEIIRTRGVPAGLVNSAAIVRNRSFLEMSLEDYDRTMAINARGLFFASQIVTAAMVEAKVKGSVVHMASIGGFQPPNDAAYGMSKAAVVLLTKAMAKQLADHGIRVNAVAPGLIDTAMTASLPGPVREKYQAQIPAGRFGEPSEIAKSVAFLLGEESSYMTGTVLNLSGGLML